MNTRRFGSTLAALTLVAAAGLPSYAQAPGVSAMPATGRDFDTRQPVSKLGSQNADLACERLYDSADPVSMSVELMSIVGPTILLGKALERMGLPTGSQKKQFDDLRVLARQKVWLPVAGERQIGEWMDSKYRKEALIVEPSELPRSLRPRFETAQRVLEGVVATLPADNPYTFTLAVTRADESNASISPGGFVYITTGMLQDKTLNRDDLALRLSHEVAHLTRRHVLKDLQVKVVDAVEVGKDLKPLMDFASNPTRGMETIFGTAKAAELIFQRFGQVQELEADACGTYLLVRQPGIDARGAVQRFTAARAGTAGGGTGWDVSHPAPEERAQVMTAQLDAGARPSARDTATATAGPGAAGKRSEPDFAALPPTAAGVQTPPAANTLGSIFDKLKKSLPGAASAPGRDPP